MAQAPINRGRIRALNEVFTLYPITSCLTDVAGSFLDVSANPEVWSQTNHVERKLGSER